MLKKLFKHEFKATYRFYLPVYIGLAILTALACGFLTIVNHFDVNELFLSIVLPLGAIVGVLAIVFAFICPYLFVCLRYYRSTATREGYLTFTLPATTNQLLITKFVVSLIWTLLTIGITLLAIFTLAAVGFDYESTRKFIDFFIESSDFSWLNIVTLIVSYANSILAIYAAISLGQFVRDHRVIASIAFYGVIYMVQQIAGLIILIPFMMKANIFEDAEAISSSMETQISIISLVFSLVFCGIFYFISNRILERKLNLP